jgi:hypothetical protein
VNQKVKDAWLKIEESLGRCCLYKKAAHNELSGLEIKQLTLASMAAPEEIKEFLKERKYEENGTRFSFVQDGIRVDLTTFYGINDNDELCNAMFRRTLTVDSIGLSSDGKICDRFNGFKSISTKIVSLTTASAAISEMLFGRILRLVWEQGYSLDNELKKRIADDKLFGRIGYRKKYCEMLTLAMAAEKISWENIAGLVAVAEPVLPPKTKIVTSTKAISDAFPDANTRRNYMWVIFSLIGATGKELSGIMTKEPMMKYYDSLCTNLQAKLSDFEVYRHLKNSYGAEFLELLMDVKEKWMTLEGLQYKRVSESDFDFMFSFISDARYWSAIGKEKMEPAPEKKEKPKLDIDISKVDAGNWLNSQYNSENYDEEEAEGSIEDTYVPEEDIEAAIAQNPFAGTEDDLDAEEEPVRKKDICIDDDIPDEGESSGIDLAKIATYEKELSVNTEAVFLPSANEVMNHSRGHKSALLGGGD